MPTRLSRIRLGGQADLGIGISLFPLNGCLHRAALLQLLVVVVTSAGLSPVMPHLDLSTSP
jgi:hypothetical protein